MKNQLEVQLAWKIIEFLETLSDLICEHYHDELIDDYLRENLETEDAWTE